MYVILGVIVLIAIIIISVLVYKNNQVKADAAMASVQSAANKVKADAAAAVNAVKKV